ncbi:hypothetical protein DPMN_111170 [Dreissena polymorpha]|uniref:Uncharacterized protein n=1 Tax=Dreissena polymorpha TaxID=45954 RepID=A0A9D4KE41_DREPO|nr:hypothetical protein DPMN_111170 [Dreissena polymorpha]
MKSAKALPRYGSGHKSAGRKDGRKDGQRQNNITPPMAGDNKENKIMEGSLSIMTEIQSLLDRKFADFRKDFQLEAEWVAEN